MNRLTLGLVVVAACGLAVGVAAWLVPTVRVGDEPAATVGSVSAGSQPKAEPPAAAARWEYAELRVVDHSYWNTYTAGEQPVPALTLTLGAEAFKAGSFKALGEAVGKPVKAGTAVEFLTLLGKDGWELTTHALAEWVNPSRAIQKTEVWTLRRAVRG